MRGTIFPEPIQVIVTVPMGDSVKLIGKGSKSGKIYEPILNEEQLSRLEASPEKEPFNSDSKKFRLGIEAMRLGLAYEFDPYFSLSIAQRNGFVRRKAQSPFPIAVNRIHRILLSRPIKTSSLSR